MKNRVLGISAYYHDSAACLVVDGKVLAAAQEERFSRIKFDSSFPLQASQFCLNFAGLERKDLDAVVFYESPFLKFDRLLENYLALAPRGFSSFARALPQWLRQKLWMKAEIAKHFPGVPVHHVHHHESHAASAFFPSPFSEAAVLTCDAVGEWDTTSLGYGSGNSLKLQQSIHYPHSLGLLYSAFTYFCGFKVNSGEYKLMGLAPYGEPRYVDRIKDNLIALLPDGSFQLNMDYFEFHSGLRMTGRSFEKLFGVSRRQPETPLRQVDMDLAASIQKVTEEAILALAHKAHQETGSENLCLAGGVALNCVANGKLKTQGPFKNIWVQAAAGDAGGALGAALLYSHRELQIPRTAKSDRQASSALGPAFDNSEIEGFLKKIQAPYQLFSEEDLINLVASKIKAGKIVGWFQGRMEFGPRALGQRSILGDPTDPKTQSTMNLKIKFRESFRPFAPSVLEEDAAEIFDFTGVSPYMLMTAPIREKFRRAPASVAAEELQGLDRLKILRSTLPGITHVDYSARLQTVSAEENPRYHALLKKIKEHSGYGVVVNTSFNVRGEPIVCTPEDAYRCFMRTQIDCLVLENCFLEKTQQPAWAEPQDWQTEFALD